MLNATVFLTIATITGLIAGFAREWLLIDAWGAGARTDAFMVALFLPEALRITMATGLMSAAALPLFTNMAIKHRSRWLQNQFIHFIALGCGLSVLLVIFSSACIYIIGPGLLDHQHAVAVESLEILAWVIPGLLTHALLSVPHQSEQNFIRVGLGSLLFNLPIVLYLYTAGEASTETGISYGFIVGSILMVIILMPNVPSMQLKYSRGGHPFVKTFKKDVTGLHKLLFPLLLSSSASQGLALFERMIASFMGEGAITLVNLARKIINIPLVALMSLNQVLLAKMSGGHDKLRAAVLQQGLDITTVITLPAAVGFICASSALVDLLLPGNLSNTQLPLLLAWMATTIVFASWNGLLARYHYAAGDTKTPLKYELAGSAVNALALVFLTKIFGLNGIVIAALLGILLTGTLLLKASPSGLMEMMKDYIVVGIVLAVSFVFIYPMSRFEMTSVMQIMTACLISAVCLLVCAFYLKPWRQY